MKQVLKFSEFGGERLKFVVTKIVFCSGFIRAPSVTDGGGLAYLYRITTEV